MALITNFAGLVHGRGGTGKYGRVALVTDIRGGQTFDELFQALDGLQEMTWTISFSSSRPPTRTLSAVQGDPPHPPPHPPGATPCRRR